jgi:hypothetical protein
MTSERILLGHSKEIEPDQVIQVTPVRTSKNKLRENGFSEPTATIVWSHIISQGMDTRAVFLWNAFPWHPYDASKGYLSNRTPSEAEMTTGAKILQNLIALLKPEQIFAIGKKSQIQIKKLKIDALPLRHPAYGGAEEFRKKFTKYLKAI